MNSVNYLFADQNLLNKFEKFYSALFDELDSASAINLNELILSERIIEENDETHDDDIFIDNEDKLKSACETLANEFNQDFDELYYHVEIEILKNDLEICVALEEDRNLIRVSVRNLKANEDTITFLLDNYKNGAYKENYYEFLDDVMNIDILAKAEEFATKMSVNKITEDHASSDSADDFNYYDVYYHIENIEK